MHAHIADDAISVLLERAPPPQVWKSVIRPQRCGPGPHFVIEKIRHGLLRRISVGTHMDVTTEINMADVSQQTRLNNLLLCLEKVRSAFSLCADLNDALMLARGVQHRLTLAHIPADRLLAINVSTGFHRGNGMQGVP